MLANRVRMGSSSVDVASFSDWEVIENGQYLVDMDASEDSMIISYGERAHNHIIIKTEDIDMSNHSKIKFDIDYFNSRYDDWGRLRHTGTEFTIPIQFRRKQPLYLFLWSVMGPEGYLGYVGIGFTDNYETSQSMLMGNINEHTQIIRFSENYYELT